jgi:hypothetical protein
MPWGGFDNLAGHHCNTFPPSTGVYGFSLAFLHLVWAFPPSTLSVLLHWTSVSLWRHRTSVDFFLFFGFFCCFFRPRSRVGSRLTLILGPGNGTSIPVQVLLSLT